MLIDLRPLTRKYPIERIETTHRYQLTRKGLGVVFIYQRTYARLLRPLLSVVDGGCTSDNSHEAKALKRILSAIDTYIDDQAA